MPDLTRLIIIIAVALIAWWATERFSPDPLITKIVQVIIFVAVLLAVVLPLLGLH